MLSKRKKGRKVSYKSKKRICITVNSHVNSSKTNNSNTSNSDNVIGNSIIPCININTKISLNKLITLQKETDTESINIINDEIMDDNNTSEEISSHQNSVEVIDHKCDDNGKKLNTVEEADVTSIHSINVANNISMNDDDSSIQKYYAPFLSLKNHEDASSGS